MFKVPILFLIFNRLDTSSRVFEEIKKQKPKFLYIAADGPRKERAGESEICDMLRKSLLNQIDWDCELKTLFRERNLGCTPAVTEAISWFFNNVEEGIILEDDCLPHPDFFNYCSELLEKYRDEEKIGMIGGCVFDKELKQNNFSYRFSAYAKIWGWATWKRSWLLNQPIDASINENSFRDQVNKVFTQRNERTAWLTEVKLFNKKRLIWDGRFQLSLLYQNKLNIIPNKNLIINIGFGDNATHTAYDDSPVSAYSFDSIISMKHPEYIQRNIQADRVYFYHYFYSSNFKKIKGKFIHLKRILLMKMIGRSRL